MKGKFLLFLLLVLGALALVYKNCDKCKKKPEPIELGMAIPFSVIQNNVINSEIYKLQKNLVLDPKNDSIRAKIKDFELAIDSIITGTECESQITTYASICVDCPMSFLDTTQTPIVTIVNCCPKRPQGKSIKENNIYWISPIPLPFPPETLLQLGDNCYLYGPIANGFEMPLPINIGNQKKIYKVQFTQEGVILK